MPKNTKDLENSKKEELEKKVESKKTTSKTEKKPTSKMAASKKSTSSSKAKSTVVSKTNERETTPAKKTASTKTTTTTKKVEKVEPKKIEVKAETKTTGKKVEVKKAPTTKVEKVEPKKVEVKKSETSTQKNTAVKKSTSTPKSKVAANATKKSTSSKTTTKKSTPKVTPISDKVAKSEATKKASSKTEKVTPVVDEKSSKSKIASLADSLFNKIKQFIAGSQNEEDSKKPNRKAKKTLANQDLTIAGLPEYYDLPYKYNDTIVKILAQTPKRLFIYWDISEKDRKAYIKAFGEDFFDKTYPVLLVHNIDKNYTFEVPVNDFANSWYLDINDSKCQYSIELGRKFKAPVELMEESLEIIRENNIDLRNDYIYITTSNILEAPNDHILFEKLPTQITFRNVKTMDEYTVDTKEYINTSSMNNLYNIEDLYKAIYKENDSDEIYDLSNPSSSNPTSRFK